MKLLISFIHLYSLKVTQVHVVIIVDEKVHKIFLYILKNLTWHDLENNNNTQPYYLPGLKL